MLLKVPEGVLPNYSSDKCVNIVSHIALFQKSSARGYEAMAKKGGKQGKKQNVHEPGSMAPRRTGSYTYADGRMKYTKRTYSSEEQSKYKENYRLHPS